MIFAACAKIEDGGSMAMAAVPLVGQIGVFLARHIEGGRILMVFRHVVVPEESGLQIRAPRWQLQTEVVK